MDTSENFRFYFRIPMFTDKGNFQEFQYLELGEQEECTLCGYNGKPQQCTGLQDKNGTLIYEGDIIADKYNDTYTVKYNTDITGFEPFNQFDISENGYFDTEKIIIIGNIYEPNKYKDVVEAIKGVE